MMLKEIFLLFFKLGLFAFGGPAAHIAMLHREVIEKRKWMSEEHFLDLVGATSLIPGPNSTEMVIHCAKHRGGTLGLFIGGLSFIVPACILTWILAYFYTELSANYPIADYMIGIKAGVVILIFSAVQKLAPKAVKTRELFGVAALVFICAVTGMNEVFALFLVTILGFLYLKYLNNFKLKSIEPITVFLIFLKIGSILFGSGYVLIAYLQDELVNQRGLLTNAQIADAIAIGQFTPGPVLSTSTFIGHQLAGVPGAVWATVGIFLPSFLFVMLLGPLIPKMRNSKNFSIFLDCINAGSLGLMAYAIIPLLQTALVNTSGIITMILLGIIYFKFPKISSVKLISLSFVIGIISNKLYLSFT